MATTNATDAATTVIPEDPIIQWRLDLSHQLVLYGAPCIIILGTIGNILTIIVMRQKTMQTTSSSLYFIVLAVTDTLILYVGLFRHWLREFQGLDIRLLSVETCKLHVFLVYLLADFSSWILVAVTAQRVIAVYSPFKIATLYTTKRIIVGLLIILLILVLINLHLFWGIDYMYVDDERVGTTCKYTLEESWTLWVETWQWVNSAIYCFLPFSIFLISYLVIIWKLLMAKKLRTNEMRVSNNDQGVRVSNSTAMFFAITFTFLVLTSPIEIVLVGYNEFFPNDNLDTLSRFQLTWAIVNLLTSSNNAINFFLYCLSGKKFRDAFLSFIRCPCRSSPSNQNSNSTSFIGYSTTKMIVGRALVQARSSLCGIVRKGSYSLNSSPNSTPMHTYLGQDKKATFTASTSTIGTVVTTPDDATRVAIWSTKV